MQAENEADASSDWYMGEAAAPSRPPSPPVIASALRTSELSPPPSLKPSLLVAPHVPANLVINRGRRSCSDLDRVVQDGRVWFGSHEQGLLRARETGITRSEDIGELLKLMHCGPLMKRGFRGFRSWTARWVVLAGRRLFYYAHVTDEATFSPRGFVELTPRTEIHIESPTRFTVLPTGGASSTLAAASTAASTPPSAAAGSSSDHTDMTLIQRPPPRPSPGWFAVCTGAYDDEQQPRGEAWWRALSGLVTSGPGADDAWHLEARSEEERDGWVRALRRSVFLVKREAMPATLMGVGSVHEHVEIGPAIGHGRFGVIHRATTRFTRAPVAVKIVNKAQVIKSLEDARLLRNEIRVLRRIAQSPDHPNIAKTFQSYEDDAMLYTVRELLCGPSLEEHVRVAGALQEPELIYLIGHIASALSVIHGLGVAVVDLSPGALRFAAPVDASRPRLPVLKIVSFGQSIIVPPPVLRRSHGQELDKALSGRDGNIVTLPTVVGAPEYLPPEALAYRQYSTSSDLWSLGCLICFCLYGRPFEKNGSSPRLRVDWSAELLDLLHGLLNVDRTMRLMALQVLRHAWLRSNPVAAAHPHSYRARLKGAVLVCVLAVRWSLAARFKRAVKVKTSQSSPNVAAMVSRKSPRSIKRSSTLEMHNSYLTLDSCAAKARQTAGAELDAGFFKFGPGPDVRMRGSGMGITSSHAGQLSELANDHSSDTTTSVRSGTRGMGAFLLALEAHLQEEADHPGDVGGVTIADHPSWDAAAGCADSVEF